MKSSIGDAGCETRRGERADTKAAAVILFCTAAGSFADVICIALRCFFFFLRGTCHVFIHDFISQLTKQRLQYSK